MPHRIIRTPDDLKECFALLGTLKTPLTLQWKQGADRSLDQNELQFKWANETAQQRGDMDFLQVQHTWKLHFGVPILRRDSAEFRETYDTYLKPLPYSAKLKMMGIISVSSEMTMKQMSEYLDMIQRECAEQGIRLTDPERQAA